MDKHEETAQTGRLLESRIDSREQFRFDSKTPALLPAVFFRKALKASGVLWEQAWRFSTRLPASVLLAALFFAVTQLSRTIEPSTRWTGLLIASLDPNLAAHASLAAAPTLRRSADPVSHFGLPPGGRGQGEDVEIRPMPAGKTASAPSDQDGGR